MEQHYQWCFVARNMDGRMAIILPLIIIILISGQTTVYGSSHGMEGYSETGCTCHDEVAGIDSEVTITGIPEIYQQGETYELSISLAGGIEASSQGHQGGFNLRSSIGTFSPTDELTRVTESGEITHEHAGANYRSWVVEWTAPVSDEIVNFTIAGNIVDGDHQPSEGDDWAINTYSSQPDELTIGDKIKQFTGLIVVLGLFGIPIYYMWKKSNGN